MIPWKAFFYMTMSALSFAIMDVLVKSVSHYEGFQLVLFRSIPSLIIATAYLSYKGIPMLGTHHKLLFLRGVLGCLSMVFFFISTRHMPIGTAVSLRYLAPLFAAFYAIRVLKEKVYPLQWVFFFVAFLGVVWLKGVDLRISNTGFILILSSAFLTGWVFILIRAIGSCEHPVVIVNYFMWICVIMGGIGSLFQWKSPEEADLIPLVSLGIAGYFGQLFMTKAIQMEEANRITPFKYLEVIFVMIIALFWLDESYTLESLGAIVLILSGLFLNAIYKRNV